jgi:hypothetical protein
MKNHQPQARKGFTMGDVLIALTLVGIASAIAYGLYAGVTTSANTTAASANARYLTKLFGEFQNAGGVSSDFIDGADHPRPALGVGGVVANNITFKLPGSWTPANYVYVSSIGVFQNGSGTP